MKEISISRAILNEYNRKLIEHLENDVVIVGSGPAGLTAAYYLSKAGVKTTVIEKRLSTGGGTWGGAAGYNVVVFDDNEILEEMGVSTKKVDSLYLADSIEFASALAYKAKRAGAMIFNLTEVEDIILKKDAIEGVVVNSTTLYNSGLPVDPFCISSKCLIDATGHPAEIVNMLKAKNADVNIGKLKEGFMDAVAAEIAVVENTGKIFPGFYIAGMAACAVYGLPRMGPIFGGMLKSGKKIAELICEECKITDQTEVL